MTTPQNDIPYVPEGTIDPAANVNEALRIIDALLGATVEGFAATPPPAPADGEMWLVDAGATGDFAGQDNALAQWVDDGAFWQFYPAGAQARVVVSRADGQMYTWDGQWAPLRFQPDSGSGLTSDTIVDAINELAARVTALEP